MLKKVMVILLMPLILLSAIPVSADEKAEREWQDESIYFIMVDRFYNGDTKNDFSVDTDNLNTYQGGDFAGILQKLDYLQKMGFSTIALNPIIENTESGYHGNWALDYKKINENYGTLEEFKQLVTEAHKRDMKVIVDFNANHVGPDHPWLKDPVKKEWFHDKNELASGSQQEDMQTGWIDGLPDLAQENPEVSAYLIDSAKWWISETNIDGYRLNDIQYVSVDFWKTFSKEMKSVKNNFFLLGNGTIENESDLVAIAESGISGLIDDQQINALRNVFAKPDQQMDSLFSIWNERIKSLSQSHQLGIMVDNEMIPRFTKSLEDNNQFPGTRWELLMTYMYTTPGIPMVYYGSEIALNGNEVPDNRRMMDFRTDKDLIEYIGKVTELRKQYPALRKGTLELLNEQDGMAVYKREYKDQMMIVAINNSSKTKTIQLDPTTLASNEELRGRLNGDMVRESNGTYSITLDRETSEVYLATEKSGVNFVYLAVIVFVIIAFLGFLYLAWKKGRQQQ
jgi:glycosidase